MFTPPDTVQSTQTIERIAIVGQPATGKTTSTLTFPNRYYGDCDHKVPQNEQTVPFWSAAWAEKDRLAKKHKTTDPANYKTAILNWMTANLPKFSPEQTYIHDSWTEHIGWAAGQIRLNELAMEKPPMYYEYRELKRYCEEICRLIKQAPCRVVTTFHETQEWEDQKPTGKVKPIQDGSFKDQLFNIYTDVYRMVTEAKIPNKDSKSPNKILKIPGYFWQVQSDSSFDANANNSLAPCLRKHNIKYIQVWMESEVVKGGYYEIQRLLRDEAVKVESGILLRPNQVTITE